MKVTLLYQDFESFKHYCNLNQINITKTQFNEFICCNIELTSDTKEKLLSEINTKDFHIQNIEFLQEKNIKNVIAKNIKKY